MFETENGTLENVFFALDSLDAVLILNSVFVIDWTSRVQGWCWKKQKQVSSLVNMHRAGGVFAPGFLIRNPFQKSLLENVFDSWYRDETNRRQQNLRQQNLVHPRCESNHFCCVEYLPTVFIARRRIENSIKKWFQKLSQKLCIHESPFPKTYTLTTSQNQILCQEYKNHSTRRCCQSSSHNRFEKLQQTLWQVSFKKFSCNLSVQTRVRFENEKQTKWISLN